MKKRYLIRSIVTQKFYAYYSTNDGVWTDDIKYARKLAKCELRDHRKRGDIAEDVEVIQIWSAE